MLASEVERMGALGELLTADAASLGKAGEEHEGFAAEVEEAKARIRHIKVRTSFGLVGCALPRQHTMVLACAQRGALSATSHLFHCLADPQQARLPHDLARVCAFCTHCGIRDRVSLVVARGHPRAVT